jgi:hypothetical protein
MKTPRDIADGPADEPGSVHIKPDRKACYLLVGCSVSVVITKGVSLRPTLAPRRPARYTVDHQRASTT